MNARTIEPPASIRRSRGTPRAVRWSAPGDEGSHSEEIFRDRLELADDETAELREAGVL